MADRLTLPPPADPIYFDVGDGVPRVLRYSTRTLQRLKKKYGKSMLGNLGGLLGLDEDMLPDLIWEGLRGPDGSDPEITVDQIADMPANTINYQLDSFWRAYRGNMPEKKDPTPETAPATTE